MFHVQRPAVALACVVLCFVQLVVAVLLLAQSQHWNDALARPWQIADALAALVLLVLLLLRLPRELRWRPRRSKRTSREVVLERQRIAGDLHDHVGTQIVNAMAQLDAHDAAARPIVQALEQCLLELRLVVDSMDGDDDVLPGRLARLRNRLQPALDRQGIALQWHVALAPDFDWPRAEAAREIAAIVQEAVSNVLQHSGASALRVTLEPHASDPPGAWRLEVCDNGCGLPASGGATGKGLANMHRRAQQLGAQLQLLPQPGGGLCVQVTMGMPGGAAH